MLDQATIDSLRHKDVAPAGHLIEGVSDTGGAGEQIEVIPGANIPAILKGIKEKAPALEG